MFCSYLLGAQNYFFENFTTIDGLSSSEVYDITQDSHGYLWFATDRGLTRYDGISFQRYTTTDGITDNVVLNFYEQENGAIWCSTLNHELFYFTSLEDGFHPYQFNKTILDNIPPHKVINGLELSSDGELYLTFNISDGYLKIDQNGKVTRRIHNKCRMNKFLHQLYKIEKDSDFIYTDCGDSVDMGPHRYKLAVAKSYNIGLAKSLSFPSNNIQVFVFERKLTHVKEGQVFKTVDLIELGKGTPIAIGKVDEQSYWIGYQYGGVDVINLDGIIEESFLTDESVTKVYKDHEGGFWVSTLNAGVFYCKAPFINYYSFTSYPTELTKDENKQLYVAFHNGQILQKDPEKIGFRSFFRSETNYNSFVHYNSKEQKLYYGDFKINTFLKEGYKLEYEDIMSTSDDADFTVGFGRRSFRYRNKAKNIDSIVKLPYRIYDIAKLNSNLLIGTESGLLVFDGSSLKPSKYSVAPFSKRISDIDVEDNIVYSTSFGSGLTISKRDTTFSINKENGLLSDLCTELFVEDPYTIWVGTNQGLNRVTLYRNNTYDIDELSRDQGLPSSEILDIEIVDNTIWVTSKEGLFSFSKDIFKQTKKSTKNWLQITDAKQGNQQIALSENMIFAYDKEKDITFSFNAVSFKNGKNALFRYRIDTQDSWTTTTNHSVKLSNLESGKPYQFELQIKGNDGLWTKSLLVPFTIATPIYQTIWFRLGFFLLILGAVVLLFKFKVLLLNKNYLSRLKIFLLNLLRSKNKKVSIFIKHQGKKVKLNCERIGYFKSSKNYLEIHTGEKVYVIREKLDDFYNSLPDPIEYVKVHRSYYVRIEKVTAIAGKKEVMVLSTPIPVSKTYAQNLNRIPV
jgi:ligand-binding sensor domain-containing protein